MKPGHPDPRGARSSAPIEPLSAVARVVIGGALGLAITYLIGHFFGTAVS